MVGSVEEWLVDFGGEFVEKILGVVNVVKGG